MDNAEAPDVPPPSHNAADVPSPQRPKFFQKSASFFSRTPASSDGEASTGISAWAKNLKMMATSPRENASVPSKGSAFSNFTSGLTRKKIPVVDDETSTSPAPASDGGATIGSFAKGFLDTSRNAVKVVQTRARHLVSQNKRRYQEGGFDLDMTYITDSIIAMGFPAGDISSGLFGYMEGFYRNHMEEVIKFFESHHKGKYKVYNLCSERLYDVSLFEGKVASFPFDDHNCPPLHLVMAFCRSAYSWLKDDLENVVVVHCKAGMARTGLMISSLLLYLKFFPTAEECIVNYNERRCFDGKGLILPSQLRYVKYFERVLNEHNGNTPAGRKCILRGIRLHKCPYWIRPAITISDHNGVLFSTKKHPRTKDLMPEDFWFAAPRKGIMVFALPGERCVADLNDDFKVHFHDRHGDFYCWLNTNMMETRQVLGTSELDGFDKRRLPSPGFQVEIVILDQTVPPSPQPVPAPATPPVQLAVSPTDVASNADSRDNDDVFSDSESEEGGSLKPSRREKRDKAAASDVNAAFRNLHVAETSTSTPEKKMEFSTASGKVIEAAAAAEGNSSSAAKEDAASDYVHVKEAPASSKDETSNDFRAIAADASVFTFGDEDDDYDSEG